MRRILYGDVRAAARALLVVPDARRASLLERLFTEADIADRHRLATGRAHPAFGTGSLMSAALARKVAPEPQLEDRDYAACMALVFEALVCRAGQGARA